jgi:hypothetical protein
MDSSIKKYLAIGSSMLLTTATLFGIPFKAYAHKVHEQACINENPPKIWTKQTAKTYAYAYMSMTYPSWNRGEWRALAKLWGKESAWDHTADNPTSSAYGIAQVLNTKPGTPAPLQIERGLSYIFHRYDKPSIAWSHWRKHGWY